MPLPEPPSTALTQACKNKYVIGILIQKVKSLLTAAVSYPISIINGGTGGITIQAARLAFKLPTTNLLTATNIDWAITNNFFNAIAANKTYTMTNIADGLSIQVTIQNTSGGTITPTFPTAVKWVGSVDPGTIAAGQYAIYSFTSTNGLYIGVIGSEVA